MRKKLRAAMKKNHQTENRIWDNDKFKLNLEEMKISSVTMGN